MYLNQDNKEGELGWINNKKYWGNGYALEAATGIIHFAIQEQNISKFIAHCDSNNVSSYRVMEKLGMKLPVKHKGAEIKHRMRIEKNFSTILK